MGNIDISNLKKSMNGGSGMRDGDFKNKRFDNNRKGGGGFRQNDNRQRGNNNQGYNSSYVGAPYNFVPFYDGVVEVNEDTMPVHALLNQELITGEVSYNLKAETPIFISDGVKDKARFVKNERGENIIPGSTMRGLIRNNVQILGLSSFDADIDDYSLMYRNVANGIEKKRYNEVLGSKQVSVSAGTKPIGVLTNVSAGYIAKKGEKYIIYKTKVDTIKKELQAMNYYVLSERVVANDSKNTATSFPLFKKHEEYLQHDVSKGFRKTEDRNGRTHYQGTPNNEYRPDYHEVSYEVKNLKNVSAVGAPEQYKNKGVLVATGPMREKKAQYIVPEIDCSKEPIEISDADVQAFKIDFEKKKNTLKQYKNVGFFDLPKDGETKPVFYIYLDGRLYFGFTPRLRLFYDHTIKEGFHQKKVAYDYAKSMFGTIGDKKSYKSKVSFSDAVIVGGNVNSNKAMKVILAEPKPSSYLDYLVQSRGETTYNADKFELRGVKQYWLHKDTVEPDTNVKNDKVFSVLYPLPKGTCFSGKVRFQNLTRAELGLLLWSICLEKNSMMNIGMAKAYGYGVVSISDVKVKTVDLEKAYSLNQGLDMDPFVPMDNNQLIDSYKSEMKKKLSGKEIQNLPHIRDFFIMKDSTKIPEETKIQYMVIDKSVKDANRQREYQNRKGRALPKISEIVGK